MENKATIDDILNHVLFGESHDEMDQNERFAILNQEEIDKSIYYYLENLFKEIIIEVTGDYEGKLFELMKCKKLKGWCWETTETAALFMPDDTIVYRGDLYFTKYEVCYHSFIQFNYENTNYVFDPCLCMINTADLYFKVFDVYIKGQTTAKEIKEYFLNFIANPPKKENNFSPEIIEAGENFMRKFFGDNYKENKPKEIVVYGEENPSHPMYRNGCGYRDINIEDGKIKKLIVHYYANG